ncbi:hypothetical protein ACFOHY_06060 [Rhizobium rosettiformans]|uniref:hypothetical protein n=1 Tax=Rhizobium rosettiformans TaxID=1368430 RepID=UPI0036203511
MVIPERETVAGPIHIASKGVCVDRAPIDQMMRNSKVIPGIAADYAFVISQKAIRASMSIC